ncbi:signal peptide-containing protein [Theileria equi strain WA]|uniref:Signal peptide-containing protein n=1 Tax=Theileria equi strain WA TaxID=1537102 RepID=L0AZP7_THEEQ|nr:signal peptide-containing protein [Theileria equi strain WA]AFZ81040.1 signal peptide-containing protein [Theileria equi strain WA]|eukprot:XP_004830706.1 signal peptide-containing protein [Theileria equi strain WA]
MKSFILFIVSILIQRACTSPYKPRFPIDFDLADELPDTIRMIKSTSHPEARYYTVKRSLTGYYRLGDVKNAGEMVCPGNPNDMDRFLLVVDLTNKIRYLRIVCKIKKRGRNQRKILEFITSPEGTNKFRPVSRTSFCLNLPAQGNTSIIQVDDDVKAMVKRYSVRPEMKYRFIIGVVKYGRKVITCRDQNLIERQIIYDYSEKPLITIISIYGDGDCGVEKYTYRKEDDRFVINDRKYTPVFLKPQDESVVVDNPDSKPEEKPAEKESDGEKPSTSADDSGTASADTDTATEATSDESGELAAGASPISGYEWLLELEDGATLVKEGKECMSIFSELEEMSGLENFNKDEMESRMADNSNVFEYFNE